MSANPDWEVTLANTTDMGAMGLLPGAFTLTPIFNRPGTFSTTFALDHPQAYKVAKHSTCVVCQRNDSVKWSGAINNVVRDPAANTIAINAVGWLSELNDRQVRANEEVNLTFVAQVGGNIARELLETVNLQQDSDGTVWPTHLTFSQALDTQVRTRAYKRGQNYGQALQELSDIENGFDVYVDPVTRQLSTRPPTFFQDRTNAVFGFGVEPYNLRNAPQNDDGTETAERVVVVGSGGVFAVADDPSAMQSHSGMREKWITLSDVSDTIILGAYANAEVLYTREGRITYDLSPKQYGDMLRLYDDFELGDKVYLSIDAGALQVDNQAMRVFSATIEVDAQGNEIISSIGTAPA